MAGVPPELLGAWAAFDARSALAEPATRSEGFANIFARGYVLSRGMTPAVPETWLAKVIQGFTLQYDPRLPVNVFSGAGDRSVVVIGEAFCSEWGTRSSNATAGRLLTELIDSGPLWEKFDRAVSQVGGRYVVLGFSSAALRVHVDPMATLSCYWANADVGTYLSSHSALIARVIGKPESNRARWIMKHPDYQSPGGKSLPGLIHPHDAVSLVFANCALQVDDASIVHERVFPMQDLEPINLPDAAAIFMDELRFQIRCWSQTAPAHYLALTAGSDSRAILSSAMDLYQSSNTTAVTYHFFERAIRSTLDDLMGASALAHGAGLRFLAIDASEQLQGGSEMARLYNATFPTWARFPTLAQAFYRCLPINSTLTLGIGGEIGTVFYQDRTERVITPELLARKFTPSPVSSSPELLQAMTDYIDATQLTTDSIGNFDFLDLFYWEHRLSKWAASGYSEYDLATSPALPLNSRRLLCAMLALPFELRKGKAIYNQLEEWRLR